MTESGKKYPMFAGHPKVSLIRNQYVFGDLCKLLGWKVLWPVQTQSIKDMIAKEGECDFIFYRSAWPGALDVPVEGVHLFRDPRDMLVSGYFSSMYSHPADDHPALQAHRARILPLPTEEGLIAQIDYMTWIFDDMRGWNMDDPRFYNIRFEEMYASEEMAIKSTKVMVHAFGMTITDRDVELVCMRYTFEKLSGGRTMGAEDQRHHFRKGSSGDWKTHFTPRVSDEFSSRYGDLVESYGYQ